MTKLVLTILVLIAGMSTLSSIGWLLAAFVLRWKRGGRIAAALLTPVVTIFLVQLKLILAIVTSTSDWGFWSIMFGVTELTYLGVAAVPAWIAWSFLEERLGHRAP